LPGWAIDLIRDGVGPGELRASGQKAVYGALVSTALSAVNAGWSRPRWEDEVERPGSKLGLQNRLGANGKERTKRSSNRSLNLAWERAEKYATANPPWTREEANAEARRRAKNLRILVADADVDLTDTERKLLMHVADEVARVGSSAVNLPRAATAQATGLGEKAVRLALPRLVERGMLNQTEHGRSRTKTKPGRANTYQIPDDAMLRLAAAATSPSRVPRQVGPDPKAGRPLAKPRTGPTDIAGAYLPHVTPTVGDASQPQPRPRPRSNDVLLRLQRGIESYIKQSWAITTATANG
jgi:hypothetical protein